MGISIFINRTFSRIFIIEFVGWVLNMTEVDNLKPRHSFNKTLLNMILSSGCICGHIYLPEGVGFVGFKTG